MENKMTQREFFTEITKADVAEHLKKYAQTQIEKLDERNAKRSSKPNKTQKENEGIKTIIVDVLKEKGGMFAADIAKEVDISTNKAAALCKQLVESGEVEVTEVKVPKRGKCKKYSAVAFGGFEEVVEACEEIESESESEAE